MTSPDDQLPVLDIQDWDRSLASQLQLGRTVRPRRLSFQCEFRRNGLSIICKSPLVRMYQYQNQVPALFAVDRYFVDSGIMTWLSSLQELWLVEGFGDWEIVEVFSS